jgi:preprotein translocase subunit SecE
MSRAMRRHPVANKATRQRPVRAPLSRPSGKPREPREGGRGGLTALLRPQWAEEIIGELRKVTWPSREETWYLTIVVLVVAVAFGIFLGGVDMFFNWAIDNTIIP